MKSKHLFGARIILACTLGVDALGDVVDLVPWRIVDQPMDLKLDIARRSIIGIGSLEQRLAALPLLPPGPMPAAQRCIRPAPRTSPGASNRGVMSTTATLTPWRSDNKADPPI